MLKRVSLAFAGLFLCASSAFAAGTIPFSLSQQLDRYGDPLSGCKLYTIQAGTTSTPQNAYQDAALTIPRPNPIICDAAGRLPQFFLADGTIKVRLVDKSGVVQVEADGIQVIGPSGGGGGGGGSVDPTTVLATGDIKTRYGIGTLPGFVRANGRTIGSATSGATERANADTQALFQYLWAADPNLAIAGGRGVSANADWVANKTIALPDFRGRAMAALADMGNSANTYYDGVTFQSGNATTLGALAGAARRTLAQANLPAIAPTFTGTPMTASGSLPTVAVGIASDSTGGGGFSFLKPTGLGASFTTNTFTPAGTISTLGSGTAFDTVPPFIFITTYLKL